MLTKVIKTTKKSKVNGRALVVNGVLYENSGLFSHDIEIMVERIMHIVPEKGLRSKFGYDALLSMDLKTLRIDQKVFYGPISYYRWILALYLCYHTILTKKGILFHSVKEWAAFTKGDIREYKEIKNKALVLARNLMIPKKELINILQEHKNALQTFVSDNKGKVEPDDILDSAERYMGKIIALRFNIPVNVGEQRIREFTEFREIIK
ncbi:MAG: hypothetical protein LBI42_00800 [Chitinispirillales bacterium]|jgi:hypothetical protein|nr:hypothetical protein [Chitinispirillales bacterium]